MAPNDIIARLRLTNILRFVRDARLAAHEIENIGDAARQANSPLNNMGGVFSELASILPKGSTETGIFGLKLKTLIFFVIGITPLLVGLGGALTALAGSFAAAAIGAGLLATGIAGMAIPLAVFGLVAANALSDFQKVSQAYVTWQKAVGTYGRNSTQAETALAKLNAITKLFGGQTILQAVEEWNRLQDAFRLATRGAMRDVWDIFLMVIRAAQDLLPLVGRVAKIVSGSLKDAFGLLISEFTSSNFQQMMLDLANAFRQMSGPAIRTVTNLLFGLLAIASRVAPAMGWVFTEIERASMAFRDWAENGSLGGFISQFKSWWGLIKAIGGLLVTILGGGAKEGQGLVDSLTRIVNKWNAWLNTEDGQASLLSFFKDATDMTRAFGKVLALLVAAGFKFGRALLPTYTKVFNALVLGVAEVRQAMKPLQPFIQNVLTPLLKGLGGTVLLGLGGAFKMLAAVINVVSTALGWLGQKAAPIKPVFEVIGAVLGALIMGPLPIIAAKFDDIKNAIGGVLRGAGRFAANIGGAIATGVQAIVAFIGNAATDMYNAGKSLWQGVSRGFMDAVGSGLAFTRDLGKALANVVIGFLNNAIPNKIPVPLGPDIPLPDNPIPRLAMGGVVSGTGSWITGEAGPELNTLRNGRVSVVPLTPGVRAQAANATMSTDERRVIVSKVYLRGKQIAEAVADEAEDEGARG